MTSVSPAFDVTCEHHEHHPTLRNPGMGSGRTNTPGELRFPHELEVRSLKTTVLAFPPSEAYTHAQVTQQPTTRTTLSPEKAGCKFVCSTNLPKTRKV